MDNLRFASLVTQQFRLRDLLRVTAHRITLPEEENTEETASSTAYLYYFTIHKTNNDSSSPPLFRSIDCPGQQLEPTPDSANDTLTSPTPRHLSIDWPKVKKDFAENSPLKSIVVRLWCKAQSTNASTNDAKQLRCFGIHFNGLVPYVPGVVRLLPDAFVFHTRTGYAFTMPQSIDKSDRTSFSSLELAEETREEVSIDGDTTESLPSTLFHKYSALKLTHACEKWVCSLDQLLSLQQRQLRLKYKTELLRSLTAEIQSKSAICREKDALEMGIPHLSYHHHHQQQHQHQHHTMGRTLTRLLNMEPERVDPKILFEAFQLRRRIEAVRVRCEWLRVERDRARGHVARLEVRSARNCDRNVETGSLLMADYHALSKGREQYLHLKIRLIEAGESLATLRHEGRVRQERLLRDLGAEVYEVKEHAGGRFTINGISLPDAESYGETHVPAMSISVALGYVAHSVLVVASVLGVPLRNRIVFKGSQSQIVAQMQKLNTNV